MPLQNRVDPAGHICVHPARGDFMGNRGGALHDENRRIVRQQKTKSWIICLTDFKGRRRRLMQPGLYTELFFLDEVTALAAGHRPCFECRRADALAFAEALGRSRGETRLSAPAIDALLAEDRRLKADDPARLIAAGSISSLPDGAMIRQGETHYALRDECLLRWSFDGYDAPAPFTALADAPVYLTTPRSTIAAFRRGYRPQFHGRTARPAP